MRITIDLGDDLLIEAKSIAARTGRALNEVLEEAVREVFARSHTAPRTGEATLPDSFGEGGLRAGVDLDDSDALLDVMGSTVH